MLSGANLLILRDIQEEAARHCGWLNGSFGLAQELLYTAVTMNTLHTSAARAFAQDTRSLQRTSKADRSEKDQGARAIGTDFSQMLGMAQASATTNASQNTAVSQNAEASRNTANAQAQATNVSAGTTGTQALLVQTDALKLANSTQTAASAAAQTLLGVSMPTDATTDNALDTDAAQELAKVLSNAPETSKKDGKSEVVVDKDAGGKLAKNDKTASDDKKPQPFAAQIKDAGAQLLEQQDLGAANVQQKSTELPKTRIDDAVSAATTAALNKVQQEAPQVQAVQASANRVADSGLQQVRAAAIDPADALDTMVTIVKDGTTLAVKFEPHGLGKLDINLSLEKGLVHGQINVHDDATKKLIESNMQQILDALQKEGLSIGGFSVSLQKGDNRAWSGENGYAGSAKESAAATSAISGSGSTTKPGLVSIFI